MRHYDTIFGTVDLVQALVFVSVVVIGAASAVAVAMFVEARRSRGAKDDR